MFRALILERKPLWLYPNLLGLNAPLIAMAWLYIFAQVWRVNYLPWTAYAALALIVWVLHIAERFVDSRERIRCNEALAAPHAFLQRRRAWFFGAVALAVIGALVLMLLHLPMSVFDYLIVGAPLVAGYFVLSGKGFLKALDLEFVKSILAGMAFAYGVAMVAHVFLPALGKSELVTSPEFLSFIVLCVLNFSAMDFWEKSKSIEDVEIGAEGDLALTLLIVLLAAAALGLALMSHQQSVRPFFYAILTGAALHYVINRTRTKWSADQLRLSADVAMLAPALVFLGYPAYH